MAIPAKVAEKIGQRPVWHLRPGIEVSIASCTAVYEVNAESSRFDTMSPEFRAPTMPTVAGELISWKTATDCRALMMRERDALANMPLLNVGEECARIIFLGTVQRIRWCAESTVRDCVPILQLADGVWMPSTLFVDNAFNRGDLIACFKSLRGAL